MKVFNTPLAREPSRCEFAADGRLLVGYDSRRRSSIWEIHPDGSMKELYLGNIANKTGDDFAHRDNLLPLSYWEFFSLGEIASLDRLPYIHPLNATPNQSPKRRLIRTPTGMFRVTWDAEHWSKWVDQPVDPPAPHFVKVVKAKVEWVECDWMELYPDWDIMLGKSMKFNVLASDIPMGRFYCSHRNDSFVIDHHDRDDFVQICHNGQIAKFILPPDYINYVRCAVPFGDGYCVILIGHHRSTTLLIVAGDKLVKELKLPYQLNCLATSHDDLTLAAVGSRKVVQIDLDW